MYCSACGAILYWAQARRWSPSRSSGLPCAPSSRPTAYQFALTHSFSLSDLQPDKASRHRDSARAFFFIVFSLEAIRDARGCVVVCFSFGDRARRRIAVQASAFDAADEHPLPAEIVRPEHAEAREQQAAVLRVVEGAIRLRIRPCRLREDARLRARISVDARGSAQVRLCATIG